MSTKKEREEISRIRKELYKYCHKKTCDSHFGACPEMCGCHRKLELNTSIAWEAARLMRALERLGWDKRTGIASRTALRTLHSVVSRHVERYGELYALLNDAIWVIDYVN